MVNAETRRPGWKPDAEPRQNLEPHLKLHGMPLAVVEAYRLHAREALERPGETDRGILTA